MVIYPTDAAIRLWERYAGQGIVEIGMPARLGISSPEEVLQFQRDVASSAGVSQVKHTRRSWAVWNGCAWIDHE